jgi:hypothetical protein
MGGGGRRAYKNSSAEMKPSCVPSSLAALQYSQIMLSLRGVTSIDMVGVVYL